MMAFVFIVSALLALHWALKEYDLLKDTDLANKEIDSLKEDRETNKEQILQKEKDIRRHWVYFRRAKYALAQWSAVMMGVSLVIMQVRPWVIVCSVGSYILLTVLAPKLIFRLLHRQPSL